MEKNRQTMMWNLLKKASEQKGTQWRDLPGMAKDTLNTKYNELRGLNAGDVGGGLLGLYMKNAFENSKYGNKFKISTDSLTYKPSNTQSYYLKHKPGNAGNIEIGAKFKF